MPEIEDRGIVYKSNKSYIKALELEIKQLQQLLPTEDVDNCFYAVRRAVKSREIRGEVVDE